MLAVSRLTFWGLKSVAILLVLLPSSGMLSLGFWPLRGRGLGYLIKCKISGNHFSVEDLVSQLRESNQRAWRLWVAWRERREYLSSGNAIVDNCRDHLEAREQTAINGDRG